MLTVSVFFFLFLLSLSLVDVHNRNRFQKGTETIYKQEQVQKKNCNRFPK